MERQTTKKILYVEANIDQTIGGSYFSLLDIVRNLDRTRFEPSVLFYQQHALIEEFKKYAAVYVHPARRLRGQHSIALRALLIPLIFLRSFFLALCLLNKIRPDLVHLNNSPVVTEWLFAAKLFGIPCISHVRGNWYPKKHQLITLPLCAHLLPISRSVAEIMLKAGIAPERMTVVYNGIDPNAVPALSKDEVSQLKTLWKIPNEHFCLVTIGNLKRWKGQKVAVAAAIELLRMGCPITCLLFGDVSSTPEDISYAEEIRDLIQKSGFEAEIRLMDFHNRVAEILSVADVLLHTPLTPEPYGRAVAEAMAHGVAVIASNEGGPAEIIEDGTSGITVPPNDVQALTQSVAQLVNNPAKFSQIQANARGRISKDFSLDRTLAQIQDVYIRFLGATS